MERVVSVLTETKPPRNEGLFLHKNTVLIIYSLLCKLCSMIKINADVDTVKKMLGNFQKQMPFAVSKGNNDRAVAAKQHIIEQMPKFIDKPTRYTLNALKVTPGTKQKPTASVWFKDPPKRSSHYLEPLVEGGPRHQKGTEIAFEKRWFAPGKAAKELGYIDGYGNFKASVLQQLRSYFGKAEQSAGYSANSKPANRENLAKMQRTLNGKKLNKKQLQADPKRGYKTIGGKMYLFSLGKGSGSRGQQHLAAGIWQKTGVHGVVIKPVLMQVKAPAYRKQFDFYGIVKKYDEANAARLMKAAVDFALASAR